MIIKNPHVSLYRFRGARPLAAMSQPEPGERSLDGSGNQSRTNTDQILLKMDAICANFSLQSNESFVPGCYLAQNAPHLEACRHSASRPLLLNFSDPNASPTLCGTDATSLSTCCPTLLFLRPKPQSVSTELAMLSSLVNTPSAGGRGGLHIHVKLYIQTHLPCRPANVRIGGPYWEVWRSKRLLC